MKAIRRFTVRPALPERLNALEQLAGNLRWAWHGPTQELFAEIAPDAWREFQHDPISLFGQITQERIDELAADEDFVRRANALGEDLNRYLTEPRWYQQLEGDKPDSIAYFSPEYGIAAALPQYSGGLGILAGDHLKSASDLGVPLVAVGLFYRSGYFSQALSPDGWQQETYPVLDPDGLPLRVLRQPDGSPVIITLCLPDDQVLSARIWQARVGRVTLLLLDSDIPENSEELCHVTDRLYGGAEEHRLRQELLLGIGGVRAISAWAERAGVQSPLVFHTNEGHAGFLGVERIGALIRGGLTFTEALQVVRAGTVFTTHTPVPAGIDRFDSGLIRRYFETELLPGVETGDVLALGREPGDQSGGVFNMALMGLRLGQRANGVSQLHGEVSRRMFSELWPGFDADDVPIRSVTNGVHPASWTAPQLTELAIRNLGTSDTATADWASPAVSDAELWGARNEMKRELVDDARKRLERAWTAQNPGGVAPEWVRNVLDPRVLTIGFARRVPTYKRLTLMLHDTERLRRILLHPDRPVQIVVAGKSHPADLEGKRLIQKFAEFAREPDVRERIVFLPNYDISMAQKLYPGTDVWLNNPLRPLEACGTSGMKAALNGVLNLSILDGWWNEFFDGENGWAIPSAVTADADERDRLEAESMYDLIEHQIAPRFYDRDGDGIPADWMRSIRHTLSTLSPQLSADRMVSEYVNTLYRPAFDSTSELRHDGFRAARRLADWKRRVTDAWSGVAIAHVESGGLDLAPQVGDELHLRASVRLGSLTPDDVSVQVVYGRSAANGDDLRDVQTADLEPEGDFAEASDSGEWLFAGTVSLGRPGAFGYTVRVVPKNALLDNAAELGLIAVA
ncbi:glycosyltransferase family 1 protein [Mycetocola manganoxydans]|uniref:glycogen phosphorylase n=1 Tax=Mycetocola manganoxydans TaxID=699879 RepID=A0A3L6ZUG5_9MICO|nr:alpha-glucan family phosphorylase [Mycetocola manganoxydans]RLP71623.1 glycosyltransferase family 1 protein [Mycetocola manganoxydans]GHD38755.1 alpha-1,4 glucan phosphorylase [Mycetocola manganoxydans]